jgi:hypothetical protein
VTRVRATAASTLRTQVGPFVMVPTWVLETCRDARAVQLYGVLAKFANREGRAWPSKASLMREMSVSARTLDRAVAALKRIRALDVELKHRGDGAVIGCDYILRQVPPQHHIATDGEKDTTPTRGARDPHVEDDHFATGGEKAALTHSATDGEKASVPFRQICQAISPPVATVYRGRTRSSELDPRTEESTPPAAAALPDQAIAEAFVGVWNTTIGAPLQPVTLLTAKRRARIRQRLQEQPLDAWRVIIARVAASEFCCGAKGWVASFDWLIRDADAGVKALEGNYDDHVTERELRAAAHWQMRTGHGAGCPHETPCADRDTCLRAIARLLRERGASRVFHAERETDGVTDKRKCAVGGAR